jgi:DNA-binding NarL/FixJ family response regulator
MNAIKIGIAEDQQIFRSGLITLLNGLPRVNVIYEEENGAELILAIKDSIPDILILNHNMPEIDGIKATKEAREKFPLAKIIILSSEVNNKNILDALENGASVYLSKNDGHIEIKKAIQGVIENNFYINERVSKVLINNMMEKGKINSSFSSNPVAFSKDELKIINLISQEYTTQQIADHIYKSTRTVEKYRTKMFLKVNVQSSVGLIIYAVKNNLIEI